MTQTVAPGCAAGPLDAGSIRVGAVPGADPRGTEVVSPAPVGLRLVVAGVSQAPVCGVRDHAIRLAAGLQRAGACVSIVWTEDTGGQRPSLARWMADLARRCREHEADAVLLHYSVFAFSWHGVPIGVPLLAVRLRRLGVQVVLFAHEYAYPWGQRGWRGAVHAVTQRAVLVPLVAVCGAAVVTTPGRQRWLSTRLWLPRRSVGFAPVFSNISPTPGAPSIRPVQGRIGLFSFGAEGLALDVVVDAVAEVSRRCPQAHLVLIGAPGPGSPAAERWRRAASHVGCPLVFTGIAEETEVSRELAACSVIVFPDPWGPSSRKTSLAAALAHGKAVVALDGPHTWRDLVSAGAVSVVAPQPRALAGELCRFLLDPDASAEAGERAHDFHEARLSAETTVKVVFAAIYGSISASTPKAPRCVVRRTVNVNQRRPANDALADCRLEVTLVAHEVHDHGGMERACAELIRHTHDQVRYTVIAIDLDQDLQPLVEQWIRVRAPSRPFPMKFMAFFVLGGVALWRRQAGLTHTVGAIVPNKIDLATIHFCHAGFRAANDRRGEAPETWPRRWNTTLSRRMAVAVERWSYRPGRVRAVAAVSSGVAEEMSVHYAGLSLHSTPNGVDPIRFRPDGAAREGLRIEQRVRPATCVALFVGGEWERKGLPLVIQGFAKARAEGADIVLWVVGGGDEARFDRFARTCGAEEAVTFFGERRDAERFYQAADLFVLPSAYETFSMVCFEAAASGLPLVIPALSGAGEIVGRDEAGIIVDRTWQSIAAALRTLADQPAERIRLGDEARRRACRYTWANSSRDVTDVYKSLTKGGDMKSIHATEDRGRLSNLVRESRSATSKGRGISSKLLLAMGPAAERGLRHLPVGWRRQRRFGVRIGALDVSCRLNAGDIQSVREVLIDEAYRLPFDLHPRAIVDLGANIGLTSLYYGAKYPGASIVAVEADPHNADLARRNLALLSAQVVEAAVAPQPGKISFKSSAESNLGHIDPSGDLEVVAITMDEVLDLLPRGRADLVKMDIEGGEERLFSANCSWLDRVDAIIIEMHPPTVDVERIVRTVESAGLDYVPAGSVWATSMDAFVRRDGKPQDDPS